MRGQHIKYLPYAFTEQGIYMLMTVLKGELATQQSLALIRIFKSMKDYVSSGQCGRFFEIVDPDKREQIGDRKAGDGSFEKIRPANDL